MGFNTPGPDSVKAVSVVLFVWKMVMVLHALPRTGLLYRCIISKNWGRC